MIVLKLNIPKGGIFKNICGADCHHMLCGCYNACVELSMLGKQAGEWAWKNKYIIYKPNTWQYWNAAVQYRSPDD